VIRPLSADEIAILITAAGAAPSMHNTQPWRLAVVGSVVDVLLDPDRSLPAEDPTGRLMRIGLGAATFNLRVAAAMLGCETTLVRDPDPARPGIVARLFLEERTGRSELAGLYSEVHRRHTFRGPMTGMPIAAGVRDRLAEAAAADGAGLTWLDVGQTERLLGLVLEAEVLDTADEERLRERARWIGGDRGTDGVPRQALGPRPDTFPAVYRDLAAGLADAGRHTAPFETRPVVAVLTTLADGPDDWLDAGQALQRVLIVASAYDLAASFVNQPLEHPEQRRFVRELAGGAGNPQQILRLGHPFGPGARTPRRPWRDLQEP
jgi:nitroreductase